MLRRNPRYLRYDVFDLRHFDTRDTLSLRLQALVSTRFVDNINGLVRHVPIIDVARCQLGSGTQSLIAVFDMVMLLETSLEPLENAHGIFYRWLNHVDLLEAPRQRAILLEDATELLEGGRTDAANLTRRQHRFEQIGSIHNATGRRTGTAYRVPIAYRQTGERLTLSTDSGWWVNLVGGREFTVRLRGTSRRATARRIRDAAAVDALRELTTIPGYAKAAEIPRQDGTVAEAALRRAAAERVVLEVAVS